MRLFWFSFSLLLLDRLTKMWALTKSPLLVKNTAYFPLPAIISLFILFGFVLNQKRFSLPLGLIITAGLSNLFDRLAYGFVIDWLTFPLLPTTFNLADLTITLSLFYLVFRLLKSR